MNEQKNKLKTVYSRDNMNPIVFHNEEELKSIIRRADAKNWARALVFIAVNEILTVKDASVIIFRC
jgi:hypothetical protein